MPPSRRKEYPGRPFIGWASNDLDGTRVPRRPITLINRRQTIAARSREARDPDSWIPSYLRRGGLQLRARCL